jgi:hypothetical protein
MGETFSKEGGALARVGTVTSDEEVDASMRPVPLARGEPPLPAMGHMLFLPLPGWGKFRFGVVGDPSPAGHIVSLCASARPAFDDCRGTRPGRICSVLSELLFMTIEGFALLPILALRISPLSSPSATLDSLDSPRSSITS